MWNLKNKNKLVSMTKITRLTVIENKLVVISGEREDEREGQDRGRVQTTRYKISYKDIL